VNTPLTDRIVALLPRLRRFALALARNREDGDDLVQATVERALTRFENWQEGTRLDSWMFKIMQNLWIDQTRAKRRWGEEATGDELDAAVGVDGRAVVESRLMLRETLTEVLALPEDQRAVLVLVVVEGFSYREAADMLSMPVGTVMSRLSRARQALDERAGAGALAGLGRQ